MSRSIFILCQALKFGFSSRQFPKMVIRAKPFYCCVSSFHTNHRFSQSKQQDNKQEDRSDSSEEGFEDNPNESKSSPEYSLVSAHHFKNAKHKNKLVFHDMIDIFCREDPSKKGHGHVEFIYSALKYMKEYGVQRDLETYKALIDVMPKGRFVAKNIIQSEYMHFPKQQQCIIDLLEQMEDYGVMPDWEMESMLINIFGNRGYPVRRYWRMMYWMPKFKNLSPWPLPNPVPTDVVELAKLAITRIMSVDVRSEISIFKTKDVENSLDDTWIVSGQSPVQKKLLESHPVSKPIYVEGGFRIYLREVSMLYFILRAEPDQGRCTPVRDDDKADNVSDLKIPFLTTSELKPDDDLINMPTVHEQEDGTIFAVCATGTSSKDSLLSWIRCLEKHGNPKLGKVPVLFTFKSPIGKTVSIEDEEEEESEQLDKTEPPEEKNPLLEF